MTKQTTLFDLNQTAATAALKALEETPLGYQTIKLDAFKQAGHDHRDFSAWSDFFEHHVANYRMLKTRKSPAAIAAENEPANVPAAPGVAAKIALLFIAAFLSFFAVNAQAGFWLSFSSWSGTNSGPLLNITNTSYLSIPSDTITVTNIQTNDQIVLTYGYQASGQTGTNPVALGTFTTNFNASTGWTNFPATWTYTVPQYNYTAPVAAWGTLAFSSNGVAPQNGHTIGVNW